MPRRSTGVTDSVSSHIVSTPGVAGGRPRIAGHRIRVQDIAIWHERMGLAPDEIAAEYELTLGEVFSALAYYFDHRSEIQEAMKQDRRLAGTVKRRTPSKLQTRLKNPRG